jgi:ribosomal protein L11 methylase PrmA
VTRSLIAVLAVAAVAEVFGQRGQNPSQVEPLPDVPPHLQFVSLAVAERMLDLAKVTSSDVVYDLGCGDGRVGILAAKKFGARAVGVDVDAKRIAEAAANAAHAGVSTLVRFERQPTIDVSEATVLTMSIPQSAAWLTGNGLLHPTLTRPLKAGSRIVTNFVAGSMKEWKPDRVDHFADASGSTRATLYVWTR